MSFVDLSYLCCGDLHIRSTTPRARIDDFQSEQIRKFQFICDKAEEKDDIILIAGDMFDTPRVPMSTVLAVMFILNHCTSPVLAVTGQHDRYFHSKDLTNTPIGLLQEAGCLTIIDNEKVLGVTGCGWENELPVSQSGNILLIHKSITKDTPPFFLEDAISSFDASEMFSGFRYIVAGDYHQSFRAEHYGNDVVNCGSMMRQNIDQQKHEPTIYRIDRTGVEDIKIPIQPSSVVFDFVKEEKMENYALQSFMEGLSGESAERPTFESTLHRLMGHKEVSRGAQLILKEVLSEQANKAKI